MALEIKLVGQPIVAQLSRNLKGYKEKIGRAVNSAAHLLGEKIVVRGRQDISGAGRFGPRWTTGLTYDVTGKGNVRIISIREKVPYWRVFQYGAIIQGRPLLWIPLSFATEAQGVRARDFPGRLFRVDRKSGGAPLLLSADDGEPKYHGQESVRIPKKFHLVEITNLEAQKYGELYRIEMRK